MRKRKFLRRLLILPVLAVPAVLFLRWGNTALQVTRFQPAFSRLPEGFDGCRIAVLSDLHGAEFGEGNKALFDTLAAEAPEYIFYLGDLRDEYRTVPPDYTETVAAGLTAIAPTFYVTGNHEWAAGGVGELKRLLRDRGVTVLANEAVTLERNGDTVVLAGIDDPNGYADQKTPEALMEEIQERYGDGFRLLLAHRNDRFVKQYSRLGADLVLSGHGHGGIVRLPFTDGLFSTNRTLFPTCTAGLYGANGSTLFVTRGLGNVGPSFRVFNRPEIAVLTLRKG